MEGSEDPLGKISRQLSELASAPNSSSVSVGPTPSSVPSSGDGQWTQFSGISPQAGSIPFSNLYSWNPLDLHGLRPLSPLKAAQDKDKFPTEPVSPSNHDEFMNQNHFDWRQETISSPRFQVAGDLAGRLVDVSKTRVPTSHSTQQSYTLLGHGNFQPAEQVFQYNRDSNGQVYCQLSQPLSSNPFGSSEMLNRFSVPSASSLTVSNTLLQEKMLPEDNVNVGQDSIPHGISLENLPHTHLLQTTPPGFDPSTPPPVFSLQKGFLENHPASGLSSKVSHDDMLDFLKMQSKANITLDLGINIERGSQQQYFTDMDDNGSNDERCRMYESAMRQWSAFDSSSKPFADGSSSGSTQALKPESQPELVGSDSLKPTYSDIAKQTPKAAPSSGIKMDQSSNEGIGRNIGPKLVKKDGRPLKPLVKRTSSGSKFWPKGALGGDADQPRMSPTSRYGLDNFDDTIVGPCNYHSSSSESLTQATRSRRGSGSSASSSVSAQDDNAQGAASHSSVSESGLHGSGSQDNKGLYVNTTKSPMSSNAQNSSGQPASKEPLFFDPRRIFQYKNTKSQGQGSSSCKSKGISSSADLDDFESLPLFTDTVLNNGKPTASTSSSKLSSSARQHDYINNDLRDANKLTNQTAAGSGQSAGGKAYDMSKHKESRTGRRSGGRTNGLHRRDRRKSPDGDHVHGDEGNEDDAHHQQQRPGFLSEHLDTERLEEWCSMAWEKVSVWGNLFITSLLNLLIYTLGLVLYLASGAVHLILLFIGKCWTLIKEKLLKHYLGSKEETTWNSCEYMRRRVGLEENICLPSTGEEAMKRLLSCKGKDPYSILGLRVDSTDEDIKKYYRKQAVLVHPDKNQEPGAEEAFKILGHAFEMIGESTKRKHYDSHTQEANEADAMREFAEMLSKLQTKIQEAANIMRCDNCGGKHRRVPVDRPFYSARFCQRCNLKHSAKEGDVWAESRMLGFYWNYYALMEGHVFDITEWMKCHKEDFRRMKANSHAVMYKIATDGNRRGKHQSGVRDANLEDFINHLFKSSHSSAEGQGPTWGSPHSGADNSWGQGTTAAAKKGRKKKKRH